MPASQHPTGGLVNGELRRRWAELRLMRLGLSLHAGGYLPLSFPYTHRTHPQTRRRHTCAAARVRRATASAGASELGARACAAPPDCPPFVAIRLHAGAAGPLLIAYLFLARCPNYLRSRTEDAAPFVAHAPQRYGWLRFAPSILRPALAAWSPRAWPLQRSDHVDERCN